jgi:hypothetical protein
MTTLTVPEMCALLRQLRPEYLSGVWFDPRNAADVIEALASALNLGIEYAQERLDDPSCRDDCMKVVRRDLEVMRAALAVKETK